ncbi:YdiU family protein [Moritella sp. Urea-trap-13]|uniref:protein adenylyltransferase SelO n=1 Tax=Moritella sp. Urea-trap-13 TaxID=2058327 RepID=UPI000C31F23E|nr:YdiU family protein [Moritella sp. Urea-trap-13]PKH07795.1 YdiU family protein [Moritella sp. Urea-trap-13]
MKNNNPLSSVDALNCDNHYARLPAHFYNKQVPNGISDPKMVSLNPQVLALLGLDDAVVGSDALLQLCSGNYLPSGFEPLAMKYTGHQFGHYNPDLGDGRGLLLAQVKGSDSRGNSSKSPTWDLHLKGAGKTPYSRQGDGRAVLRSSIREYLCSAAMQGLGIPTTQALSIVVGSDAVMREQVEQAAMVVRVAESHVRFGHFEHFYYTQRLDDLKLMLDYTLTQHFPDALTAEVPYLAFYKQVVSTTAELMAHWQAVGFVHGVMNTDNMSILGQTFDYGPFAFQDNFDPAYVCNHTDYSGRYAFNQQPQVGYWNLMALGRSLTPFMDVEPLNATLQTYDDIFLAKLRQLMRAKLGLQQVQDGDGELIKNLLEILASSSVDYTYFFRSLSVFESTLDSSFERTETVMNSAIRDQFIDRDAFDTWALQYQQRLTLESSVDDERKVAMDAVNPKYILRNYLAQQAIEQATAYDYSLVNQLREVLASPFAEHPEFEKLAALPPEWGRNMVLSCSS